MGVEKENHIFSLERRRWTHREALRWSDLLAYSCAETELLLLWRGLFLSDLLATLNVPNRDNIMHHFMVNQIPTELKLEFDRCWTVFICFTLDGYWLMPRNLDVHFSCNYMGIQYDQVICHIWRCFQDQKCCWTLRNGLSVDFVQV